MFTVNRDLWKKLPVVPPPAKPSLSAAKVVELAEASLESSGTDGDDDVHVTKLELRHQSAGDPHLHSGSILFYVVDFNVDGSEVQRLVLMDGTVIKPQLKRLQAAEGKR